MADIKLYFILVNDTGDTEVSVHRDLTTILSLWKNRIPGENQMGLIHIGFVRPKVQQTSILATFSGHILITAATKWSLPDDYVVSQNIAAQILISDRKIPVYLVLGGFGYQVQDSDFGPYEVGDAIAVGSLSIIDAAFEILNSSEAPLSKEEIFARICEKSLHHFTVKKPVTALGIELDRFTQSTIPRSDCALIGTTKDGKYFSLAGKIQFKEWLADLAFSDSALASRLSASGIFDSTTYFEMIEDIPKDLRDKADLFRYRAGKNTETFNDLERLIQILPVSILRANLAELNLPVRVLNCLMAQDIICIDQLKIIPSATILNWPNFGKKSWIDLCKCLIANVESQSFFHFRNALFSDINEIVDNIKLDKFDFVDTENFELLAQTPLKSHFEFALTKLKENHRKVIEHRTGLHGEVKTLEEIGQIIGVTRERVRQIQKKYVDYIINTQFWDDVIAIKIGQLLSGREKPLYLEMLELEDPWFKGFMGNYLHLGAIIELFSENEIRIIKIDGADVVTRIRQEDWHACVSEFREQLKDLASESRWSKADIDLKFKAALMDKGATELISLIWYEFSDSLQFSGEADDAVLLVFGRTAESAISFVLQQAEKPLHYSEIAVRATEVLGKQVDERRAQNAVQSQGAKLYGRGIYGLEKHNPISERMNSNIRLVVTKMMYEGPLMKQWHAGEILLQLKSQFTALPNQLDNYLLSIILSGAEKLTYLNRMVWSRSDSGQIIDDRIDMADAFTKILEENGSPLKGKDLKKRLSEIRGVAEELQIQAKGRLIQVGPDTWGLTDRDILGNEVENERRLDILFEHLNTTSKGIHITEVDRILEQYSFNEVAPSSYVLLNLAQRDSRFHLTRTMFLGLSDWGGDVKRLNVTQAVRKILDELIVPLSTFEINAKVEDLTGLVIDGTVTGILINEGGVYDPVLKVWNAKIKLEL